MIRRSLFVFMAVFMMVLLAFSQAFAVDTVSAANGDGSVCTKLVGGGYLSDKITASHSKEGEWEEFKFSITKPLEAADWKTDSNFPDGLFDLGLEIKAPDGAIGCKVYYPDDANGKDYDTDNGFIHLWNAVPKGRHIGTRSYEFTIEWLDASNTILQTTYPKIRCIIIDDSAPKPVPASRITAGIGKLKQDGIVIYPNGQSVSTKIAAVDGAVYYSLNGGADKQSVIDGAITITASQNTAYIISWYDENDSLIKAETISVCFYFEVVPASWLKMGLSGMEGNGVSTVIPEDGSGSITGDLIFNFDFAEEQWQELLYNSVDSQYIQWPFTINLPEGAKMLSFLGTGYNNEAGIDFIFAEKYLNAYDGLIGQPIRIGNVSLNGSKAVITPNSFSGTYLFKWIDKDNAEHFHKINFQVKHASEDAVTVDSVEPGKSRLEFNTTGLSNVSWEYEDGVVTYFINARPADDAMIRTTVERPTKDAVKVMVLNTMNGMQSVYPLDENSTFASLDIEAGEGKEGMITYKLEWLDEYDNPVASPDLVTIKVLPIYAGVWMDEYWAPVGTSGIIEDGGLSRHLTYNNGCWTFQVNAAYKDALDADRLSTNERLIYVPVPEGAKYFNMTSGESSLYWYDGVDGVKNVLTQGELIEIEGFEAGIKHIKLNGQDVLACHFGSIFTKSSFKDDNLDVYVVNEDVTGHATYRIIEWYDEGGNLITMDNGKRGQYIYMVKKPYMQSAETQLQFDKYASITPKPGEAYAIVWEYKNEKVSELNQMKFRCEVPLQKENNGNNRYVYQKLDLIDADGNVVELPEGTTIKVVLPYPEGLNKNNTKLQHFDVWHYEDDTHGRHESMRQKGVLALEDIGVTFTTDDFSPFLLSYEPASAGSPSKPSGGSSGSRLPSIAYPVANQTVEAAPGSVASMNVRASNASSYQWYIDRNDGKGFVPISGATAAEYITSPVEAENNGYRYFCRVSNAYGSVDSAVFTLSVLAMNIPKTGDASMLLPILIALGAAAAKQRKK
ncbi:MAG: immunoglobulin domain-containing protein [Clostridia bacterium]|nr:immunoglobulin domain-containing protein [Clostridia bacterium]